jgi:hypothetical protein
MTDIATDIIQASGFTVAEIGADQVVVEQGCIREIPFHLRARATIASAWSDIDLTGNTWAFRVYRRSDRAELIEITGSPDSPATAGGLTVPWSVANGATLVSDGGYTASTCPLVVDQWVWCLFILGDDGERLVGSGPLHLRLIGDA